MPSRERIPDETRHAIEQAIRDGGTCRGIARDFEVSPGTVRNIGKEAGITGAFTRASTQNATRARVADMAARRAGLAEKMIELAEHISKRATESYKIVLATKDAVHEVVLSEPPLGEVRQALTAVGIAIDKHIALIRFDTKDGGINPAAGALVDRLAEMLHHDFGDDEQVDDGYPTPLPPPAVAGDGYEAPDMAALS